MKNILSTLLTLFTITVFANNEQTIQLDPNKLSVKDSCKADNIKYEKSYFIFCTVEILFDNNVISSSEVRVYSRYKSTLHDTIKLIKSSVQSFNRVKALAITNNQLLTIEGRTQILDSYSLDTIDKRYLADNGMLNILAVSVDDNSRHSNLDILLNRCESEKLALQAIFHDVFTARSADEKTIDSLSHSLINVGAISE